jgi:glycosyltransferase involved in cell wall biosynthesis
MDGINIIRAKKPYRYGATTASLAPLYEMYSQLKKIIRNDDVDVVNAVLYRPVFPVIIAAKNKVPCIATIHLTGFKEWRGYEAGKLSAIAVWIMGNIAMRLPYDKVITVSETLRTELLEYYPREKMEVVYNGVDLERIDNIDSDEKNPNQVIYIGSLNKRKNVLDAVKAVELARNEIKDLELVIVSSGGEYEGVIKEMSRKNSFIRYYKKATDEEKMKLLKESSLLVHPSLKESFGIVAIEALACNTPFLAYDIPALKEVCKLTSGGMVVKHGDYETLSQRICDLLRGESKLKEMAKRGRKKVEEEFTWEKVAKKEERIFKAVLEEFK